MSEMMEVARNSVQSSDIDQMGHMNVQFYVDHATDGLAALGIHLGLGPRHARSKGARLFARNLHVRFLRERRPGAPFYLRAGVLRVGDDYLTVYQEMVGTVSGNVAATFTMDMELLDETSRSPRSLPAAARDKADALLVEQPTHGRPRGLDMAEPRPAPTLREADAMGMLRTYQARIQTTQCDAQGRLVPRHFMGIVSNAVPNLLAQTRGDDRSRAPKTGGAALEYRFVYRRYPRVDDVLTLRSGLKQVAAKTYTWCHWLFDLETGESVASAEAVGIALDLEARKAIPIPDAMRAQLDTLVIDGLGV